MIEFLCPNGHPIHCRDEQAGRAAKCPRCGVKFRIPELAEAAAAPPVLIDSDAMEPEAVDMALPAEPTVSVGTPSAAESQIEFVCPNGHRLHGPASLQGHPGECPACGSKFRIPGYDDVSDQEETELEDAIAGTIEGEGSDIVLPRLEDIEEIGSPDASGESPSAEAVVEISSTDQPGPRAATHPLAEVFGRLWIRNSEGSSVELRLADGETLSPDRFVQSLSGSSHAVFSTKESDGTHTLTAVAWDSIHRVVVRGVRQLPEETSD